MSERYKVVKGSESGHCCFKAAVVDTHTPDPLIPDELDWVCECFDMESAQKIVDALNATPQPAEQHPVAWIRMRGDRVILSRCDWMYPASTEDSAGPRDEQRFTAVGRRDGDIVLPAPEGSLDREDLKTMLAWPSASKPAEQQPAPDVEGLVSAAEFLLHRLREMEAHLVDDEVCRNYLGHVAPAVARLEGLTAAYRKQGGEICIGGK